MYQCVGLGLCAFDYLLLVERYPARNQKVDALAYSNQGGGPVATAMATLGRLGVRPVAFLGKTGDDWQGEFIVRALQEEGVDTGGVLRASGVPSAQAFVWVEKVSGQRTVVLYRDPRLKMKPDELPESPLRNTRFLLIDGREPDVALQAARLARQHGAKVVMDAGSPRPRMEEFFLLVDFFVCSADFIRAYAPEMGIEEAMRTIHQAGPKWVVVTLGEDGAIGYDGSQFHYEPAFSVTVVDTTGAGDVFHGAFVYGLLCRLPLSHILSFAGAVAAMKCTRLGGRQGIPRLPEVKKFLKEQLTEQNRRTDWLAKLDEVNRNGGE
jgi:ribokinase